MRNNGQHECFMRECFRLAGKGQGSVSPNPLVGAVLVANNTIVARGWHKKFGGPHAEVECLRSYRGNTRDTTLYVNLEPCSHFGKTPPCVDLILRRGIRTVVVAMKDPNPLVAGKGIARLRRKGVNVRYGVLEEEARDLNRFFVKHIVAGMPYVHVKVAQSQDGFIGQKRGGMQYLTSPQSRRLVHVWRSEYAAVLVGAGTIKADNPRLDVRLTGGRDPDVVILDGNLTVHGDERVFYSANSRRVIVCTSDATMKEKTAKAAKLAQRGAIIIPFRSRKGTISLRSILSTLCRYQVGSVLVEGGHAVFSQFIMNNLFDELSLFVAPVRLGKGIPALTSNAERRVSNLLSSGALTSRYVGKDFLINHRVIV